MYQNTRNQTRNWQFPTPATRIGLENRQKWKNQTLGSIASYGENLQNRERKRKEREKLKAKDPRETKDKSETPFIPSS